VQCDLNETAPLRGLGTFDIIHCYGVLYHVENPEVLLQYMSQVCAGFACVETCVSAARDSSVEWVDEIQGDYTQSSTGRGCRPTRQWVFDALRALFPFVYLTKTQPAHPEFPVDWNNLSGVPPLIRSVFVASKQPFDLPTLSSRLLDVQERLTSVGSRGRNDNLRRALATIREQEQRTAVLEQAAAERLAAMQEKDEAIIRLSAELERALAAINQQDARAAILEQAAAERLAAMHEKDEAMARLRAELERAIAAINQQHARAAVLEQAAAERLAAMHEKDEAMARLRAELESRGAEVK
jgi:hypothetical protein